MGKIKNIYRKYILKRHIKKIIKCIESESMDIFLEMLLKIMSIVFFMDKDYRKNIENFKAKYVFKTKDNKIAASVIFKNDKMIVKEEAIKESNVTIIFKDGKALKEFLFTESPDIIASILDNEISYTGNINYLAKFAFMAKNLQLKFAF